MFCWYESREELLNALRSDLVGFMYAPEESEEEEPTEFLKKVADVIDKTSGSKRLAEPMRKGIDKLLVSPWRIPYIGTYADLQSGSGSWERALRAQFRATFEDGEVDSAGGASPITEDERAAFDEFITAPLE